MNALLTPEIDHKKECPRRPFKCEFCGHNGTYRSITGKTRFNSSVGPCHHDACVHYPLKCPNNCSEDIIKRKDLKTYQKTCPLEPLNCPFQHVGCSIGMILLKDIESHCQENTQAHLLLVVQITSRIG